MHGVSPGWGQSRHFLAYWCRLRPVTGRVSPFPLVEGPSGLIVSVALNPTTGARATAPGIWLLRFSWDSGFRLEPFLAHRLPASQALGLAFSPCGRSHGCPPPRSLSQVAVPVPSCHVLVADGSVVTFSASSPEPVGAPSFQDAQEVAPTPLSERRAKPQTDTFRTQKLRRLPGGGTCLRGV